MKKYGFFIVSRKNRWCVSFPDDDPTEWSDTEPAARSTAAKWKMKMEPSRDQAFQAALEKNLQARDKFIAECTIEIVTVSNPQPFQNDFKQPTVIFPDGSTMEFREDTPQPEIDAYIETCAQNEYPDPSRDAFEVSPEIKKSGAWDARLFLDGSQHSLPDIDSWSYFFPMESVTKTLNNLAEDGWSVVHVSEDRGLYSSEIVSNMSAPVAARYLLARDGPKTEGDDQWRVDRHEKDVDTHLL